MLPCTVSSTCPFCAIATAHPHESLLLTTPPPNPSAHSCTSSALPHLSATTSSSTSTSHTSPCTPTTTAPASSSYPGSPGTARVILSTPYLLAFLDHAPISRGHVLVATRAHREKLADISVAEGRALGSWLGIVSRAVMRAVASGEGNESGGDPSKADWNLVQNNGARAAQVVPHVHFHIVPRSDDIPEVATRSWTVFGKGGREDLDDEDADLLVERMRRFVKEEVERVGMREGKGALIMLLGEGLGEALEGGKVKL